MNATDSTTSPTRTGSGAPWRSSSGAPSATSSVTWRTRPSHRTCGALAGHRVTFESELTYRDGKPRYVRATYTPDVGEDGRVRGFVAHVNDISDLKQAEAEREQLRRHADELARVSRRLTESLDIGEVAERIAECILPLFQAQSSVVRLLLPDGSLACVAIAGKWLENFKPGYILPPGVGLVGRAVIERRALWT